MKKKNFINFCITLFFLIIFVSGTFYFAIKYTKAFDRTVRREIVVSENGLSKGIENVYDSVVVVETFNSSSDIESSIGTGFIISEKGYIITNQHVVSKSKEIKVILTNGNVLDAFLVGEDEYDDIAVLQINPKFITSVAKIGNNDNVELGDTVFAIGTPLNSDYAGTVTRGIISGKDRLVQVSVNSTTNDWIMKVMQTDASLNPGNSGGPLCDISGNVIGVNTMKISEGEIEGIGFAIPIEDALNIANKLIAGETIKRAYLGISMSDISTSSYILKKYDIVVDKSIHSGVIVVDVFEGSSCERAGVLKGDVIISVGNYDVKNIAELKYYLSKFNPGDDVDIGIIRENKKQLYKIVLDER